MTYDENNIRQKCAELVGEWTFERPTDPDAQYVLVKHRGATKHRIYPHDSDVDNGLRLGMAGVPDYTRSADAALELVEWTAKPENGGRGIMIQLCGGDTWSVTFRSPFHLDVPCYNSSLPLAICLAFLRANGVDPESL